MQYNIQEDPPTNEIMCFYQYMSQATRDEPKHYKHPSYGLRASSIISLDLDLPLLLLILPVVIMFPGAFLLVILLGIIVILILS